MEFVPALTRQLKAYSTWIAVATGIFNILYIMLDSIKDQIDPGTFALINAILVAMIKIATLIKQNIPVTSEEKQDMVLYAENVPTKD